MVISSCSGGEGEAGVWCGGERDNGVKGPGRWLGRKSRGAVVMV